MSISKLKIIPLLLTLHFVVGTSAQETIPEISSIAQADKDWKKLSESISHFGQREEKEAAIKKGILALQRYYDKGRKTNSKLSKLFWDKYPEDRRRLEALSHYFNVYSEPYFIAESISDSLNQAIEAAYTGKDFKRFRRLIPKDDAAYAKWQKTGDGMAKSILESDVGLEVKADVELMLIRREFRRAKELDFPLKKEDLEMAYWNRFEIQYWQYIRFQLENYLNKYAELEVTAQKVQYILNLIKHSSVAASNAYWKYFYESTGVDHPMADEPGVKALHEIAAETVRAIESLEQVGDDKPLDIRFTAIDGTNVDLNKMRGKVVLVDFWATYCAPCIKEMPHVQALYDKYRDQGFEVIGIAADGDANRARVESILKKTGANWPQRLDQGSEASVSFHALYEIKALPTVWLLDKNGVIVDTNARGARLEPLIRKYLGLVE